VVVVGQWGTSNLDWSGRENGARLRRFKSLGR